MELWIRSQDKEALRKINCSLYLRKDLSDYANGEVWFIVSSGDKLGEYATKERALEILDGIQERMINNSLINRKIYADNFKKVYDLKSDELKPYITEIYEMPEE